MVVGVRGGRFAVVDRTYAVEQVVGVLRSVRVGVLVRGHSAESIVASGDGTSAVSRRCGQPGGCVVSACDLRDRGPRGGSDCVGCLSASGVVAGRRGAVVAAVRVDGRFRLLVHVVLRHLCDRDVRQSGGAGLCGQFLLAQKRGPFGCIAAGAVLTVRASRPVDESGGVGVAAAGVGGQASFGHLPSRDVIQGGGGQVEMGGRARIGRYLEWCAERPAGVVGTDVVGVLGGAGVLFRGAIDWCGIFGLSGDEVVRRASGCALVIGEVRVLAANAASAVGQADEVRCTVRVGDFDS